MSDYKRDLLRDLKSPAYAAKYLSAAYADSNEAFLVALRDVASAQKGITKLAETADVNRENLYRMLSREGNPRMKNLRAVFDALKLRVKIEPWEIEEPYSVQSEESAVASNSPTLSDLTHSSPPTTPISNLSRLFLSSWATIPAPPSSAVNLWTVGTSTAQATAHIVDPFSSNRVGGTGWLRVSQSLVPNPQASGSLYNPFTQ